jgi:hypothetical protein
MLSLRGPVCIAESERGLGVALALFEVLQKPQRLRGHRVEMERACQRDRCAPRPARAPQAAMQLGQQ